MSSLLDLGPLTEEVDIRGHKITVHGLTTINLFKLFGEFPDLGQAMGQLGGPGAAMMALAPDLIAKVIAMATGSVGNAEIEAKAREMGAADQMVILGAVQRLTFPQGFGPFVEQITKLMGTNPLPIPPASTGVPASNSGAPLSASLQTESPGMTRGTLRRDN